MKKICFSNTFIMRTEHCPIYLKLFGVLLLYMLPTLAFAQLDEDKEKMAQYQEEVRQMVSFLEYSMNVLGNPAFSAKEKDVVINESYTKIFVDGKVQIEDDLDDNRDVVTNKDVQAYLKDVDFFFKEVKFSFNILDIDHSKNHEGKLFFVVKLMRSLKGVTVENDSMNSDQERYIEVNVDEENKDLKIASIYTTKLSRDQELTFWWAGLSEEWKTILGVDIEIKDGLRLNEIREFSDSTYIVDNEQMTDSVKVISFVKRAAARNELNLSGTTLITDLKPLDQLKELRVLDISSSGIADLFPIRNITTLTYLDCSNTAVEDLSPLRYSKSLKELYINNTPVGDITVIENFDNLEVLHLEHTVIDSLPKADNLKYLRELNCGSTNLATLDSIKYLRGLENLDISNTSVSDLSPLGELKNLKKLNLSRTKTQDLNGIGDLTALEELSIENTEVDDLAKLEKVEGLKVIYADYSGIEMKDFVVYAKSHPKTNVVFISGVLRNFWDKLEPGWKTYLTDKLAFDDTISNLDYHRILNIATIDISGENAITDLSALRYTPLLEVLDFEGTSISDLTPIRDLVNLRVINGARSGVADLSPLKAMTSLKVVNFEGTTVSDVSPLSGLQEVDTLIFNGTSVKNVSVLNKIQSFKIAYFDQSSVTDEDVTGLDFDEDESVVVYKSEKLKTWWGNMEDKWQDVFIELCRISKRPSTEELHKVAESRKLEASGTSLRNLDPVAELTRLESLSFTETRINSLYPLAGLRELKILKCPRNPISEIDPLRSIELLEILDLNNTQVDDLRPLSSLMGLRELTFSGTNVKDLDPIEGLVNLEVLDFSKTKVRQIKALDNLSNLKTLNCYNNKISDKKVEEFRTKNPECEVVFY
jgi:Leucine-rich repeat (LRR) protein